MARIALAWLTVTAVAVCLFASRRVEAAMTPIACAPSSYWSYVYDTQTEVIPETTRTGCVAYPGQPCPHYKNGIQATRYFLFNKYVSNIQFAYDRLDTELNFDPVTGGRYTGTHTETARHSGYYISSLLTNISTTRSFQAEHAYLRLFADSTVSWSGFKTSHIVATCDRNDDGEMVLREFDRYGGVLFGTNDVIYAKFPALDGHQTLALWGATPTTNVDFDLYLKCGGRPTEGDYTYRGYRGLGFPEFLHTNAGECGAGQYWHVAIHSYNGSGQFNLVWARHKPEEHRTQDVGPALGYTPTSTDLTRMTGQLRDGARLMYAATEGQVFMARFKLHTNPPSSWNACRCGNPEKTCKTIFEPTVDRGFAGCGTCTRIFTNNGGFTVAHEWGHEILCLGDEYRDDDAGLSHTLCGHSLMGDNVPSFCVTGTHNTGGESGWGTASGPPRWDTITSRGHNYYTPGSHADFYNYLDFDFDSKVALTTQEP